MSGTSLPMNRTVASRHEAFLEEALGLAARIAQRPWPNPPVGALVVRNGEVIGRGAHQGAGQAHAERIALAEAGERSRGATLYCTLEPCRHHGRTPPCTDAILAAGITRVVVGIRDLNPPAGGGIELLRQEGVEVVLGVLGERCLELAWPFVATDGLARPYVELKTATSLDGRFAGPDDPSGRPAYLTGEAARRGVHERRRWLDLVLVGAGTLRSDSPRLDTRLVTADAACPRAEPMAGCVVGRSAARACDGALGRQGWLCFHPEGFRPALPPGVKAIACPANRAGVDPAALLASCQQRGLHTILLESGPTLAASFLAAGLVDRWVRYTAPLVLGGGVTWPARFAPPGAGFHLTRSERVGGDLCTVWDLREFAAVLRAVTCDPEQGEHRCSPA